MTNERVSYNGMKMSPIYLNEIIGKSSLLGNRLVVGRLTLDQQTEVRPLVPQPNIPDMSELLHQGLLVLATGWSLPIFMQPLLSGLFCLG